MTLWMRSTPLAEIATSHYRNSVIAVCLLGLLASALSFFLQVGAFNENGLTGMFELEMILLLWETPIGTSTVYRVSGVIVLVLTFLAATFSNSISVKSTILRAALGTSYLIGTCMSVLSFSLVGHTSESSLASQLFISLHVCAAFWWIGSLYSLWFSCHTNNINELQSHLYQFGRAANIVVIMLVGAGLFLIIQLVGSAQAMFNTAYGLSLSLKLMLVTAILLIAIHHKYRLVPKLVSTSSVRTLARSIKWEGTIAIAILFLTAILSTVLGPETII